MNHSTILAFVFIASIDAFGDGLSDPRPDRYDIKMADNDRELARAFEDIEKSKEDSNVKAVKNKEKLNSQKEKLKKHLNTDQMYSLTDGDFWQMIYDFIKKNIADFLKDQTLFFTIYMRYSFCAYIIPLLPTQYFLIFPSFWKIFVPNKVLENESVKVFVKSLENFLKQVKERSDKEMLPVFVFTKSVTSEADLDFLLEIPDLLTKDPVKIIRWLSDFKLENSTLNAKDLAQKKLE